MAERTCQTCDADITNRRRHARFCSKRCKDRARTSHGTPLGPRPCGWCGHTFEAATDRTTYCTSWCANVANQITGKHDPIPWYQCRVCSSWFVRHGTCDRCRRHTTTRVRFVRLTYQVCDSAWCSRHFAGSRRRRFCSDRCRTLSHQPTYTAVSYGECQDCGALFVARGGEHQRYCSKGCRPNNKGISPRIRRSIYERDGWRCQLCGHRVDRRARYTGRAPSLDHIIPRSLGGTDQPHNLQLAHRSCNTDKGIQAVGEQLRIAC